MSKKRKNLNAKLRLKRIQIDIVSSQKKRAKKVRAIRLLRRKNNVGQSVYDIAVQRRAALVREMYRRRNYFEPQLKIPIIGQFGLEEDALVSDYLKLASSFTDQQSRHLNFDLNRCTRMWPSAVMLMCSLKQWVDLTHTIGREPKLSSTAPSDSEVNGYLVHCGFYRFVTRRISDTPDLFYPGNFDDQKIVKIRRETENDRVDSRENEIMDLLNKYSDLSDFNKELFLDVVLLEITGNVLEHGVANKDNGWWLLAQYHPTHKIISLCIADNGIGMRNSLATGPQREDVISKVDDSQDNDGEYIKMALTEVVSGARDASVKEREWVVTERFPAGARRGNGLKRVGKACRDIGIPFTILSHHGAVSVDKGGNIIRCESLHGRVFAGTMYNFVIKAK
jgi:hypothetical protein